MKQLEYALVDLDEISTYIAGTTVPLSLAFPHVGNGASVPIPKFASLCACPCANFGIEGH